MKKLLAIFALALALIGCARESEIASHNLSQAADNFEVNRRIVFYNGMTNDYMLSIEGLCSIAPSSSSTGISVTCKVGPKEYKKHILGLSDNVTYFMEQRESVTVNPYQYRVVFKPLSIIPDIEVRK